MDTTEMKLRLLPTDDADIERLLDSLEAESLIRRGAHHLTVPNFRKHQSVDKRWSPHCRVCGELEQSTPSLSEPLRNGGVAGSDVVVPLEVARRREPLRDSAVAAYFNSGASLEMSDEEMDTAHSMHRNDRAIGEIAKTLQARRRDHPWIERIAREYDGSAEPAPPISPQEDRYYQ